MAVSTCVKCNGHSFEVVLFTPIGDNRKLSIVQCSSCGTPIGMMDPATGLQIEALKAQVAAIDDRLSRIAKALQDSRRGAIGESGLEYDGLWSNAALLSKNERLAGSESCVPNAVNIF